MSNKNRYMDPESASIVDSHINHGFHEAGIPVTQYGDSYSDGSDLGVYGLHSQKHELDRQAHMNADPELLSGSASKLNEKLWRSHLENVANEEVRAKISARLGEIAAGIATARANKKRLSFFKPDPDLIQERHDLIVRDEFLKKRETTIGGTQWSNGQAEKIAARHGDRLYQEALDDASADGVDIVNSQDPR